MANKKAVAKMNITTIQTSKKVRIINNAFSKAQKGLSRFCDCPALNY